VTEFGLLLTPTTRKEIQDLDKFRARMEKYPNGTTMPNLATQVSQLLPTPRANQVNGCNLNSEALATRKKGNLEEVVAGWVTNIAQHQATGEIFQLSPQFVSEMMGFPTDWTELPFQNGEPKVSKPTETL
jgi:hypothetical protein